MNKTSKIGLIALAVVALLMMVNQMYEVVEIGNGIRLAMSLIASVVVVVLLVLINRSQKEQRQQSEQRQQEETLNDDTTNEEVL